MQIVQKAGDKICLPFVYNKHTKTQTKTTMKITINEQEYELKYTFRSLMIYESITKQSFNPTCLTDVLIFFYSCILAADKTITISFDTFMDWIDQNPYQVTEFSNWLTETFAAIKLIDENADEKEEKKEGEQPKN